VPIGWYETKRFGGRFDLMGVALNMALEKKTYLFSGF